MTEASKIEWTDSTFNPWEGCTKVGPGCDHCYAESRNARFSGGEATLWGPGAPRRRTSESNWNLPLKWGREAAAFMAKHGRRRRVFCASLADVFDNEVDPRWRADLLSLIARTPSLDWLLLTKRIGNAARMIDEALGPLWPYPAPKLPAWPWPNVWLGATIVNQEEADRDIPKLLATPAAVRFLSMEPLLGPVDLKLAEYQKCAERTGCGYVLTTRRRAIDWIIVGGESGKGSRPIHPAWGRGLRDQCAAADVPFLFKQWGEYSVHEVAGDGGVEPGMPMDAGFKNMRQWRDDLQRFADLPKDSLAGEVFRPGAVLALPVGKVRAGRLLDGVQHDGYPEVA